MNATQQKLKLKLQQALVARFGEDYVEVDPILVAASNPKFGDFQANVALSLSKKIGNAAQSYCYSHSRGVRRVRSV